MLHHERTARNRAYAEPEFDVGLMAALAEFCTEGCPSAPHPDYVVPRSMASRDRTRAGIDPILDIEMVADKLPKADH